MSGHEEKTPMNAPIVHISWQDIVTADNWGDDEGPIQPIESITVGYLIEETATYIVVGSSYDYRSEQWGTKHAFPKLPPEVTIIKPGKEL